MRRCLLLTPNGIWTLHQTKKAIPQCLICPKFYISSGSWLMLRATWPKLLLLCPYSCPPAEPCGSSDTTGEALQGYFGMFWLLILPHHPWLRGVCVWVNRSPQASGVTLGLPCTSFRLGKISLALPALGLSDL